MKTCILGSEPKGTSRFGRCLILQTGRGPSAGAVTHLGTEWTVSRIWRNSSVSFQPPWHADTVLGFFRGAVATRHRERVKAACVSKCVLWVRPLGETPCHPEVTPHVATCLTRTYLVPSYLRLSHGASARPWLWSAQPS